MGQLQGSILVSGGSGLIGSALQRAAKAIGLPVTTLVRRHHRVQPGAIYWNPTKPQAAVHPLALEGFAAVVHLSGANVGRRWTHEYRREIVRSRVESTQALCRALSEVRRRPPVLICASAVGIYGNRGDEVLTEASTPGRGFLAETCIAWEAAASAAQAAGIRVVHVRLGVVLSRQGGALRAMLPIFHVGLGGRIGSGTQWVSWVSLQDAVRAIFFLIEHEELAGAFNLAAPHPVTNQDFTRALATVVHRPAWLPVPAAALRLVLGSMAQETLLASQRAVPCRLQEAGFDFDHPEIGTALKALLR
jgi:hypothetical protein